MQFFQFFSATKTCPCNNKATRTDDVDVKFIKQSNAVISPVLCKILNLYIVNGEFPDDMKIAEVVPIYKRGDPLECSNNRPISLLSNFSKILEKVIFFIELTVSYSKITYTFF